MLNGPTSVGARQRRIGGPTGSVARATWAEWPEGVVPPPIVVELYKSPVFAGRASTWHRGAIGVPLRYLGSAILPAPLLTPLSVAAVCSPMLSDRAEALLQPSTITRRPTCIRPRCLPLTGLWTCGRVLWTGPSPTGRVDKSWSTSLLTTTCPHSRASRPQGPQAPNNKNFTNKRKRIYAQVRISWVRFLEHKRVHFDERPGPRKS